MAKKKKMIEPIVGTGRDPDTKLMVQKSVPLLSLWRSDMSLPEFKILDAYLSRINSHNPEQRTVIFTKGELEQLLGIKKVNKPQLAARLKSLGRFVDLEDGNTRKVHQVALFEEAYGEMDENGLWSVKLTCTAKAMKYIFNVEKLGYLRYKLHSIVSLKSRYAYVLFLYLEHNRFRKSWEVDVDVLRQFLNCDQDESYAAFKVFNDRILKRCQKELLEKTECRFSYTPIKKGRNVVAVRFELESIVSLPELDDGQISMFDEEDPEAAIAEVLPKSFSKDQVHAIYVAAENVVPHNPKSEEYHVFEIARYLRLKVAIMEASKNPIPHPYNYLLKVIENEPAPKPAKSARKEVVPDWMPGEAEIEAVQKVLRTAGNDPDVAARAEALKEELQS